ncbi:MAG: DNA internalization-related competence protein ComEC/Rec2 [Nitrospirota bacterium]|mgnify:FL=1
MRRPLIFLTIFYIYGITAAELSGYFPFSIVTITILIIIAVFCIKGYTKKQLLVPLLVTVTALTIGFSYMLYMSRIPSDDISHFAVGEKMTITGTVDEPATHYPRKVVANLQALTILKGNRELPVSGRIRLTIYDAETDLNYGDTIRFTGRLKKIRGFKNPGIFDYSVYVSRKGIRASAGSGKKENIIKIGEQGNPLLKRIYIWRENIRLSMVHGLSDQSSAVLQAMIIGTTGDLTPELRDKFTAAGVTHILSISGSHLGFVTLLIFFITRYLLTHLPYRFFLLMTIYTTPSKIAAFITLPPIIFYTFLSGGEVATIRSLIMAIVFLSAILIERDDDPINTLVIAALLVLIWDPQGLFDISFQLSYIAVLAMIISVSRLPEMNNDEDVSGERGKWRRKLILFLMLTVSSTVSTAPIVAHYFNQITWVGLLSNMIIIPYAGFTVVPIGLLTSCIGLILNAGVIPLAMLNELLLTIFLRLIDFFATFPLSVIHTPSPGIIFIILLYLFFISLLFLKNRWAKMLSVISISSLLLLAGCSLFSKGNAGTTRVTFLDVGQGDSALIEFPGREIMIVDGGGTFSGTFDIGRSVVAPYLWNKGVRTIDYMVLSHPQTDHAEGLVYLLDKFHVGEVWTNGMKSPATYLFDRIIQDKGIRHLKVNRNMEDKIIGGCRIHILNPPLLLSESQISNSKLSNDLSVVMRVACKDKSFLFTGDIEAGRMREISSGNSFLNSSVIKVPHHGAKGSVENSFISSVNPDIAVISAGYQNSYRHPSPEAISAYNEIGAAIYRTDLDGAVILETGNGKTEIRTYNEIGLKKVSFDNLPAMLRTELTNLKMTIEGCCNEGL